MAPHINMRKVILSSMKLQKHKAREYKGKSIYKYTIIVPPQHIKELGWEEGIELVGTPVADKGYFITSKSK